MTITLGRVFAAAFLVAASVAGGAQAASAAEPNSSWCGLTCQGRDPYQPVPGFSNTPCAHDGRQEGATVIPKETASPYLADSYLPVSLWYSPTCQTTWARETNRLAIGRVYCNFGVSDRDSGVMEVAVCPVQGQTSHSLMLNDHSRFTRAYTYFTLSDRFYDGETIAY